VSLAYAFDAATRPVLPAGFRFARSSPAAILTDGRLRAQDPHVPSLDRDGLRLRGARANLVPALPAPTAAWQGGADFLFRAVEPLLRYRQGAAWVHRATLRPGPARRWLVAPGSGPAVHTLSAWWELLDAETAEVAISVGGARLAGTSTDGGRDHGHGPNDGRLVLAEVATARADDQALELWPAGPAAAALASIPHHVQYEAGAFASDPILAGARAEERCAAELDAAQDHATAVAVLARSAAGRDGRQVLWQLDDGTEANRLTLVRDGAGDLRAELVIAGGAVATLALGELADGAAVALELRLGTSSLTCRRDAGPLLSAAHPGRFPATAERWGGAAVLGSAWFGSIAKVARWVGSAADDAPAAFLAV
jgi:hypothetical protein